MKTFGVDVAAACENHGVARRSRQLDRLLRHFTHLKTHEQAKAEHLLLSAILADGINIGLSKIAESCPGTTYAKLPPSPTTMSTRPSLSPTCFWPPRDGPACLSPTVS